uniref:Uncharacterized protein n=1 Tax=viral metagenome TaxID=1070528 RepID=A0A6C0KFW6_9ZZZZ
MNNRTLNNSSKPVITLVRVCKYCSTVCHRDETGIDSRRYTEWFCSITCFYLRVLVKEGPNYLPKYLIHELISVSKKPYYKPSVLSKKYKRVTEFVNSGKYKVLRTKYDAVDKFEQNNRSGHGSGKSKNVDNEETS